MTGAFVVNHAEMHFLRLIQSVQGVSKVCLRPVLAETPYSWASWRSVQGVQAIAETFSNTTISCTGLYSLHEFMNYLGHLGQFLESPYWWGFSASKVKGRGWTALDRSDGKSRISAVFEFAQPFQSPPSVPFCPSFQFFLFATKALKRPSYFRASMSRFQWKASMTGFRSGKSRTYPKWVCIDD
jgi:hypothetical protein